MESVTITPQLVDALNGLGRTIEKCQKTRHNRLGDKEKIEYICKCNGLSKEISNEAYDLYNRFTAQHRKLRGYAKEAAFIVSVELTMKKNAYEEFDVEYQFEKPRIHIRKIGTEMQRFMNSNC